MKACSLILVCSLSFSLIGGGVQAQTVRQLTEDASRALSMEEKITTIFEIIKANSASQGDSGVDHFCIPAAESYKNSLLIASNKIRQFFGGAADPLFSACVNRFCGIGEGHTTFAKSVYFKYCPTDE